MKRLAIASLIFFLAFIAILARLFYWQVIKSKTLAADAQNQYASQYSIFPNRGRILAFDKAPLVANEPAYLLFAQPKKLPKDPSYLDKLAGILEIDEASITARLNFKKSWVALEHYIVEEKKNKIDKLNIEGIGFEEESRRFYPEGSSSAHLLGFVGQDVSGEPTGYFGLEGYYDEILRGKPGFVRQEKDALGFVIPIGKRSEVEPVDGADLILNIDKGVQKIVEEKLKEGIERYGAKGGGVVVMRPDTGAVLTMVSFPSYDPAKFTQYDTSLYKNPLIANTYEPGSTFKVLIMAAAINENKVKPDTTYNEDGPVNVQGYTIRTWNNKYGGRTNMVQVLERSSNVGMVFVSTKLERDLFYKYLKEYGFGQKTGIDLQEEVSSSLRKKNDWKIIDLATASFGQGIAVTPIQLIRAVGSIANGGFLVTPQVASSMVSKNGKLVKFENKPPKRVLSKTTTAILSEMMVSAVDNGGAKWAKPKGFRIAGKTGTAQIPIKGHYDTEKTIASFIGFAPVEKPAFIMLVVLREPTSSPWGSETAAPLFFDITRDLFAYLNIFPQ
jgi:cell division protein FtsI/penicillin-binding protein 2